jgi:DNA polymerase III delta subunit
MLIFLYGPDDYRRLQKKKDIIAEFRKKRSELALDFFDCLAKDWYSRFEAFAKSQSLFEPSRLAVLDNVFELEDKDVVTLIKPFADDESVKILVSERSKPVKALSFLLDKPSFSQKFENLEGAEWLRFVAGEAKKLDITLTPPAAQFLASVYQGNAWALVTELQKLSGLTATKIDKKDLDVFDLEVAPNYWMLLNGMKSFDFKIRLSTLERLFALNDPPAKVFNILAAQAGQNVGQFAELDFQIKSGKVEYEEALLELIL